jgi:hypothetical protein
LLRDQKFLLLFLFFLFLFFCVFPQDKALGAKDVQARNLTIYTTSGNSKAGFAPISIGFTLGMLSLVSLFFSTVLTQLSVASICAACFSCRSVVPSLVVLTTLLVFSALPCALVSGLVNTFIGLETSWALPLVVSLNCCSKS